MRDLATSIASALDSDWTSYLVYGTATTSFSSAAAIAGPRGRVTFAATAAARPESAAERRVVVRSGGVVAEASSCSVVDEASDGEACCAAPRAARAREDARVVGLRG